MQHRRGHYLGTEIDGKWWKRYTRQKLFARGLGEYWYDREALCFRRYLTRTPIRIPFEKVVALRTGRWHAGRWAGTCTVIKFVWSQDGLALSSGFVLARDRHGAATIIKELQGLIRSAESESANSQGHDCSQ